MAPRRPVIECADGRDRAIVNVVRKDEENLGLRRVGIDLDEAACKDTVEKITAPIPLELI